MRAGPLALAVVATSLALAACGGGGDEEVAAPATTGAQSGTEPSPVPTSAGATVETAPPGQSQQVETASPEPATTAGPAVEPEAAPKPLPGLPAFTAGYRSWMRLNAKPVPPNPDGDAHLGTKNVYVTEGAGLDGVYPAGAVIVKDAVRPDVDFVGLVAIMRKERGADPAHNDWLFDEYTRSSADAPFELTAADEVCWSCHMGAAETDYVWIETLGLAR